MDFALILASISFVLAVVWGPFLIRILHHYRMGKRIRIDGPRGHMTKQGTPTMGGLMVVVPVLLITVALNIYNLLGQTVVGRSILVPLGVMLAYALIGALDDIAGVRGMRRGEGYSARQKTFWELLLSLVVAGTMLLMRVQFAGQVGVPGVRQAVDLGWLWLPIAALVIYFSANSVNFTDGLDGLAGIIVASAFAAYAVGFTAATGEAGPWSRDEPLTLDPPREGSLEALFQEAGFTDAFLDLRGIPAGGEWLRDSLWSRPMGYGYMYARWPAHLDGMIFTRVMERSTPASGGAGARRSPPA